MNTDEIIHEIGTSEAIIEFATTPARAFMLIGSLQLALRHPENTGASAAFVREMADHLTEAVCLHIPEARKLIMQGWDPAYDVTREYYDQEFTDHPRDRGLPFLPSDSPFNDFDEPI